MRGVTEVSVRSRLTSSSGRRYSIVSDEEGSSASRSPSDVLAYKEIQSQRRSRKKNPSVRNRSGQPDTPHQRLGRPPISGPSNSSSFYSYDADSDEENWGRIQTRIGSSRAHLSDSRTSCRSDMSRAPHVADSRGTMLRKYSSARGQRNVSFSNLDDQRSCGSLGNDDSMYDLTDEGTDTRSNRARRAVRKKEKGDGAKRPGNYHSKVIQDMNLGQENLSMSHVTASFGDINMMYGSNVRLSQGRISRISLADVSSALSSDSTVQLMNKRSSRPTSSITGREHAQKWKNALESEFARQDHDESTRVESWSEIINELPPLPIATESTVPEDSVAQLPAQAQHGEKPEKLFTRVERRKPLVVLEDLNVIHRLPVSSAFTFSFYELPSQHRKQNESIKKAASRIAHRPKKEFGHFRSRSAP